MSSGLLSGLLVAGKQETIPLKDVSVKATVSGYLVGLDSTLKYHNEGDDPVEVVFRFPLEESFAVVGLEAVIAGRRIKAEVKEKEEAQQTYDDAIASGFSAALAEEKSGDIFSISLGNLPSKTEAELHLNLAGELPVDVEGGVRFTLPAVLKPRYTPQGSTDPLTKIEGRETSQVQHATAPAIFNFNLEVAGSDGISNVTSPTHDIRTETREGRVHVSLSKSGPLDKDLVLLVLYSDPHQPKAIAEPGHTKSGTESWMSNPAVMLNFFPKFSTAHAACEFVFVVDRSGSMRGEFIKSASETLVLFLKSIPPGCHFNIIGFGSRYQSLFPKSVPYNQKNLNTAIRHAEGLQADLGGTELLGPLRHIFGLPLLSGLLRQVFVLTDGSVSNTSVCIDEVKKNMKCARCFTFGIGSGASSALVKGLARAGNGTAEFIQGDERMQPKVISSLKRALQPSVTDLTAEFKPPGGYEILQAPAKLPTIFNGDKAVVYGIVRSKGKKTFDTTIEGTATLRGIIHGKIIEYSIPFQIPKPSKEETGPFAMPMVHHLAAKSLLKDWEAGEGVKQLKTPAKEVIIKLSIDSSVVSAHTAYVAMDEDQDKPIEGAIQTWDVTAMMSQPEMSHRFCSVGGVRHSSGGDVMVFYNNWATPPMGAPLKMNITMAKAKCSLDLLSGSPALHLMKPSSTSTSRHKFEGYRESDSLAPRLQARGFGRLPPLPPPPAKAPPLLHHRFASEDYKECGRVSGHGQVTKTPSDKLSPLISLQQAEGFWKLDAAFAGGVLSKSLPELEKACPGGCQGNVRQVWATVLALAYLEACLSGQREEWELVAMKAEFWLEGKSLPDGTTLQALREAAKKYV